MSKSKIILSSLVLAIGLASCASQPTIKSKTETIGDVDNLKIVDMRSGLSSATDSSVGGLLTVQAGVKNEDSVMRSVYYRCNFFDGNKFQVGPDGQWIPVIIYGGQTKAIQCLATTSEAVDFKIELSSTGTTVQLYK